MRIFCVIKLSLHEDQGDARAKNSRW